MEQAPRARARKQDAAWENAVLKTQPLHRKGKAVKEPGEVTAVDQAEVYAAAPVEAAAKVAEKAAAGGNTKSTIQPINDN